MGDAEVGRALRRCRESVRPKYTQRDLADCILSSPASQTPPFSFSGDADALAKVIDDLEIRGTWTLPHGQLGPFLGNALDCLDAKGASIKRLEWLSWWTLEAASDDFVRKHRVDPPPDDD